MKMGKPVFSLPKCAFDSQKLFIGVVMHTAVQLINYKVGNDFGILLLLLLLRRS